MAYLPFHVVAKPAGPACNLQCRYCFYLDKTDQYPKSVSFRMLPDILEKHIRHYLIEQPPNCPEVQFLWQGGEPTLAGIFLSQ